MSKALLALLILIHLAPVWYFRYFPTQDGPVHAENAVILRQLIARHPETSRYYQINPWPEPNWTSQLLMAALTTVAPARIAEKLVVSLYIVLLPIAVAYAASAFRGSGEWGALLVFPFIYSLALHKGLYNFCLSLAIFFFLVGYAFRTKRHIGVLLALSLLLFFCHIISLLVAYLIILPASIRKPKRQLLALVPALGLALAFFLHSRGGPSDVRPVGGQLLRLLELDALASFRRLELNVTIAIALALLLTSAAVLIGKCKRHDWSAADWWLAAVAGATLIYVIAPNSAAGGGQITFRLSLYPWLILILWLATQRAPISLRAVSAAIVVAGSLTLLTLHVGDYRNLNQRITEYTAAAEQIPPHTRVLAIDLTRDEKPPRWMLSRVRDHWHGLGYAAAERDLVDLGNYQAAVGYFPVRFREDMNPGMPAEDSKTEIARALRLAAEDKLDQILIWQSADTRPSWTGAFDQVHRSPSGHATIYRVK